MNFLVYDETRTVDRLLRSLLIGLGQRVSISSEPDEARLKVSTALFDAIVLGPAGAPKSLADLLDTDFAHLPVVLAGLNTDVARTPRIHAALRSPISPAQFTTAIHRLQSLLASGTRRPEIAVEISDEESHLLCKATRLSRSAMMVEGVAPVTEGLPDEFTMFFQNREARPVTAAFRTGVETLRVPAAVAFAERTPASAVRLVGVRFLEPLAETVLDKLVA